MIICADFDKTIFFREDQARTAANLAAIKKWREAGNVFVLATNRGPKSVNNVLPDWRDYFDFLILDSGGRILDTEAGLIWSNTFKPEILERMLAAADNNSVKPKIAFYGVGDDDFTLEKPDSPLTKIRFWFQDDAEAEAFLSKIKAINNRAFVWAHDSIFRWNPEDTFRGYYAVVDVAPDTTNKAAAMYALAGMTHAATSDVTTVGDNVNDYEMLREFDGYAIAESKIAVLHPELPTTPSVADLVAEKLQNAAIDNKL